MSDAEQVIRKPGCVAVLLRTHGLTEEQADAVRAAFGVDLLIHWREGRSPEEVIRQLDEAEMLAHGWIRAEASS